MFVRELIEGARVIYGRSGNKTVRKYRCTSGVRKGRIVAKAATCTKPTNVKQSRTLAKTKRSKGPSIAVKTGRTRRANPFSKKLSHLNTGMRSRKRRSKGKRI